MLNPFDTGYYCSEELREFGFAEVGRGVRVARNCTIMGLENIRLDDHSRIDGFCTIIALEGVLSLGAYAHIHTNCVLGARGGIEIGDFTGISHHCRIFTASDDLSGEWLTNSTLPPGFTRPTIAPVKFGRYVPVGAGCSFLPGVSVGEGSAVYAHSLVSGDVPEWTIAAGVPARFVRERKRRAKALAMELMAVHLAVA